MLINYAVEQEKLNKRQQLDRLEGEWDVKQHLLQEGHGNDVEGIEALKDNYDQLELEKGQMENLCDDIVTKATNLNTQL